MTATRGLSPILLMSRCAKGEALFPEQPRARIHRRGVVAHAAALPDLLQRRFDAQCRAIGPVRDHRLDDVGQGDHARLEQDRPALQTLRITAPVDALMVLQNHLRHRPAERHVLQDVPAGLRVAFDDIEFGRGEPPRLQQNVRGNFDVADIVQIRRDP